MLLLLTLPSVFGPVPALTAIAGIRAPMLIGAIPIAAVVILLGWRHHGHGVPAAPAD